MNLCFTAGKQNGLGTGQSTCRHPKSTIIASILYGLICVDTPRSCAHSEAHTHLEKIVCSEWPPTLPVEQENCGHEQRGLPSHAWPNQHWLWEHDVESHVHAQIHLRLQTRSSISSLVDKQTHQSFVLTTRRLSFHSALRSFQRTSPPSTKKKLCTLKPLYKLYHFYTFKATLRDCF